MTERQVLEEIVRPAIGGALCMDEEDWHSIQSLDALVKDLDVDEESRDFGDIAWRINEYFRRHDLDARIDENELKASKMTVYDVVSLIRQKLKAASQPVSPFLCKDYMIS